MVQATLPLALAVHLTDLRGWERDVDISLGYRGPTCLWSLGNLASLLLCGGQR